MSSFFIKQFHFTDNVSGWVRKLTPASIEAMYSYTSAGVQNQCGTLLFVLPLRGPINVLERDCLSIDR